MRSCCIYADSIVELAVGGLPVVSVYCEFRKVTTFLSKSFNLLLAVSTACSNAHRDDGSSNESKHGASFGICTAGIH